MIQRLAICGKGGIGKTTLAANLSAALAEQGTRVLLVGCDPKADSGSLLHGCATPPTLLGHLRTDNLPPPTGTVLAGYRGIACVEVGDALDGGEFAIGAVDRALGFLETSGIIDELMPEVIIYDAPGTVGCRLPAWLTGPGPARRVLLVASGDYQSLFAANALLRSIARQDAQLPVTLVANGVAGTFEEALVRDYAQRTGLMIAATVYRSLVVRHGELYGRTVIETAPHSYHAACYRRLAQALSTNARESLTPRPLPSESLREWAHSWGELLGELEFGMIRNGAGI